jgi:uncharacterized protein YecT (DUF1311 family)
MTGVLAGLLILLALGPTACSSSDGTSARSRPTGTSSPRPVYVVLTPTPWSTGTSTPAHQPTSTPKTAKGAKAATPRYQPVAEPFSAPGTCNENGNTQEMTACILEQVVDVDSTVDSLQVQRFELAPASKQAAILAEYAAWLKNRSTTCNAKAKTGGSIDQLTVARCLLQASQDRVETLKN